MDLLTQIKAEIDSFGLPIGRYSLKEVVLEACQIINNYVQAHCDDQALILAQNDEIAELQSRVCVLGELVREVKDDLPYDLNAMCEQTLKEAGCK